MQVILPTQTKKGIIEPDKFFELRVQITKYSEQLFHFISQFGTQVPITKHLDCHVIAEAYTRAFSDFGLKRVSGYFGMLDLRGDQVKQFEHSWCISPCAPEWVIDVSPFHGALNLFMVNAHEYPWSGIYRKDKTVSLQLTDKELVTIDVLTRFFEHARQSESDKNVA